MPHGGDLALSATARERVPLNPIDRVSERAAEVPYEDTIGDLDAMLRLPLSNGSRG